MSATHSDPATACHASPTQQLHCGYMSSTFGALASWETDNHPSVNFISIITMSIVQHMFIKSIHTAELVAHTSSFTHTHIDVQLLSNKLEGHLGCDPKYPNGDHLLLVV